MNIVAKIDKVGRILVPAQLRANLGLQPGMDVVFSLDEVTGKVELSSRQMALRSAQVALAKYKKPGESWSEELIEERRREAARELEQ